MGSLSAQQEARSRKNLTVMLKALCAVGQSSTASAIGLHESTVSRWKDGELEKLAVFLAVVGLKVEDVRCESIPAEELSALRVLARSSSVLSGKADQLGWEE